MYKTPSIDRVTDTDGIEIVNKYLNDTFPTGIIVVQDGRNTGENKISPKRILNICL
ncbi:MAG: hypothetical protein CM15mP108_2640 [Gammaproteobacteria bacterium]|nr:MAG: hypothetical protein CM15mP108_2640 [Gammaproteobacteria bacterium]